MNSYSNTKGIGSADWLMGAITKNPEGLLLLAAGCALLLRKGTSTSGQRSQVHQTYAPDYGVEDARMPRRGSSGKDWQMPEGISQAADTARQAADTAREYASNASRTVREKASSYASAAGEYAEDARQTIMDQSGRIAQQTQSAVERIVREQPLAVAIAGLAAGAAVASAFPATRIERETLGVAGQRLSEAASSAGERLSEAASAAGERLVSVAEQRGVSATGLKEVARDVAGTFEKSLTGGQQDERMAPKPGMPSSAGASPQYGAGSRAPGSAGMPGQSSGATSPAGSRFDTKLPSDRR
jgi:hypothetical protein